MLPEVGASELVLIAIVALIVVGPKDLPMLLRKLGQFMAKLRSMAADFRASFDEMARQSELDELRREVDAMRRGQTAEMSAAQQASSVQVQQVLSEIDLGLSGAQFHPPMSYQYAEPAAELPPAAVTEPAPVKIAKPRKPRATTPKTAATVEADVKPAAKPRAPRKPKPGTAT